MLFRRWTLPVGEDWFGDMLGRCLMQFTKLMDGGRERENENEPIFLICALCKCTRARDVTCKQSCHTHYRGADV